MTFPKKPGYDSRRTFDAKNMEGRPVLMDLLATAGRTDAELAAEVLKELYPVEMDEPRPLAAMEPHVVLAAQFNNAESKIQDLNTRYEIEAALVAQIVRLNTSLLLYMKHFDDVGEAASATVSKMTEARAECIYQLLQHSIAQLHTPQLQDERIVSAATNIIWDNMPSEESSVSSEQPPTPAPARKRFRSSTQTGRNLPEAAREILQDWLEKHWHHPYPTEQEREELAQECGIRPEQVNNWFINQRCRRWKPENEQAMKEAVLLGNDDKIRELLEKADDQNPFKKFYRK